MVVVDEEDVSFADVEVDEDGSLDNDGASVVEVDVVEEGSVDDDGASVVVDVVEEGSVDDDGASVVVDVVDAAVVVDVVDVDVVGEDDVDSGPSALSLTAGESPPSAGSMLGSFPSIPNAQIPIPPRSLDAANCAASYKELGTSKKVSCHWVPTSYDVQPVSVVASQ